MRFVLFYHSLISDWNHGNAHFLRGVATELLERGHEVRILEPAGGWSLRKLREEHGEGPIEAFHAAFPGLRSELYDLDSLALDEVLDGADIVIVHEWNDPALVRRIGHHRARCGRYRLLFHDTHHRAVSAPAEMAAFDLSDYDGVLAFGETLRQIYEASERVQRAWTWHEAADTRVFRPAPPVDRAARNLDLVWIGNWGDGEREREILEFIVEPVRDLRLRARMYGVRYPAAALQTLRSAGIEYGGWIANHRVPEAFARARLTVHVPRRFYREQLPGIPTIRVFEALACRIPLVSAPWDDCDGLFTPGRDFLPAADAAQARQHMQRLLAEPDLAEEIAEHGHRTVMSRHTCGHRVTQLLEICHEIGAGRRATAAAARELSSRQGTSA